ncbi:MAG TPA: CBS domain-containing protein [Polyangiaceae bacterium]
MTIQLQTAAALMTSSPVTIEPTATLRAAAIILSQRKLHCLIVPAVGERMLGVITSKDIVQVLCDSEPEMLDQLHVSDALTQPAITVQADHLIVDCLRLMRMCGVRSVPVMRGTQPVGILSFTDVLHAIAGLTAMPA